MGLLVRIMPITGNITATHRVIGDAVDTQREGVGGRGFWRRRLDVKGGSGVDMAVSTGNCVILRSHVPDVRADRLKEDLEGLWWGWYDSGWVG